MLIAGSNVGKGDVGTAQERCHFRFTIEYRRGLLPAPSAKSPSGAVSPAKRAESGHTGLTKFFGPFGPLTAEVVEKLDDLIG
jgi:hypothetical protein